MLNQQYYEITLQFFYYYYYYYYFNQYSSKKEIIKKVIEYLYSNKLNYKYNDPDKKYEILDYDSYTDNLSENLSEIFKF